jgi:hypothetical protein
MPMSAPPNTHGSTRRVGLSRTLVATLAILTASPPLRAQEFEPLEPRRAADVLPTEILSGEHYQIGDLVETDGFYNFFDLQTDFGPMPANSNWELEIRLLEVEAMAELAKVTMSKAFAGAVGDAALAPVDATADLVQHPVSTVKSVGKGVSNLF